MDLSLLTLNLHSYQEHPRYCSFDTMHQHEPEVNIIDEAIAYLESTQKLRSQRFA